MQTEINNALKVLKKGGIILYPTDTVWGIGCDATNSKAISKVYNIKSRAENKSLIILVDEMDRLQEYVEKVPEQVKDLIQNYHKPLTVVFPKAKNLAKNLIAKDGTIAIRVVNHQFCKQLIKALDKPLVSTSANVSGTTTPIVFRDISDFIKEKVNYVVNIEQEKLNPSSPSTVIKIDDDGNYEILRG
jgi:L-threonylcarbamoyladenylate synthase